jgi:hypothetical protein
MIVLVFLLTNRVIVAGLRRFLLKCVAGEGSERHKHPYRGEQVFARLGDASYSINLLQAVVISGSLNVLIKCGWLPIDIPARIAVLHNGWPFLSGVQVFGHLASPECFAAAVPVPVASHHRPHTDGATH